MGRQHLILEDVQSWLMHMIIGQLSADDRGSDHCTDPGMRFREIGLDSGQLLEIVAAANHHHGCNLGPTAPWEFPTPAALAAQIVAALDAPATEAQGPRMAKAPTREAVAVVGIGCRLPGGVSSPAQLWTLLCAGQSGIRSVPGERWDAAAWFDEDRFAPGKSTTRLGGFLDDIAGFEPGFFGISPREAAQIDPQQRLILELAWEALEDARIGPGTLHERAVGVFTGAMWSDYARLLDVAPAAIDAYTATGQDTSIISARVSYFLGLQGPSLTVNTACSSSLVAIHLACQSLHRGESVLALAGGVHLMSSPLSTVAMTKFGAMNPAGQCRAFDAGANGYVRGEGGGLVVLEPLSRALAAGRRIYCVIRGSAVNNDGFSNGLTAPNPRAQLAVLRAAVADAGLPATSVDYVETHGPGTILGDPMEAGALGAALGAKRPGAAAGDRILKIGSIKTNLGHLEAAAGVAGLIKTALALHHRALPRNLHFDRPNPHIDFAAAGLEVQTRLEPWPERAQDRPRAGVSSFGFGGTNCHALLEAAPTSTAMLLALAAEDRGRLRARALWLHDAVSSSVGQAAPLLPAPALGMGKLRATKVVHSRAGLLEVLAQLLSELDVHAHACPSRRPKLVFVCPGHGSQWPGMARALLCEPVFRHTLEACERELQGHWDRSLLELLASEGELDEVDVVQVVLCAVAIALGQLWRAWGIEPDAIVGHSVGEIAAAQLAGAISLAEAMRIVVARSRAVVELGDVGGMLVVHHDQARTRASLGTAAEQLVIAVDGAPDATVLSGTHAALARAEATLSEAGLRHARVDIRYPSHSPAIDPALPGLERALAGLRPQPTTIPLRSTVRDAWLLGPECDASHWVRNLRDPVRLATAIEQLAGEQACVFLELGGHPVVGSPIRRILAARAQPCWTLSSGRRHEDSRAVMLDALAQLHQLGFDPRWRAIEGVVGTVVDADQEPLGPVPLLLSGKSEAGLAAQARRLRAWYEGTQGCSLIDLGYSLAAGRTHLEHRAVLLVSSREQAIVALDELADGAAARVAARVEGLVESRPKLALLEVEARLGVGGPEQLEILAREHVRGVEIDWPRLFAPAGPRRVDLPTQVFMRERCWLELEPEPRAQRGRARVIFVFPGQGGQWLGMGRILLASEPSFRQQIEACDRALAPHFEGSVIAELEADEANSRLDRNDVVQPVLWAFALGLAALWRARGIEPDAVVGHSMGEIAAACVSGALSLEDAARLVALRSRVARERAAGRGEMAVVELPIAAAEQAIAEFAGELAVAVHNGPRSCVLSGAPEALATVLARLERAGVFCRRVKVDYASHSPLMEPLIEPIRAALQGIEAHRSQVPMLSTVTASWLSGEELGPDYWARNLVARVRFAEAVERLLEPTTTGRSASWADSPRVFVELGPHPVLVPAIADARVEGSRSVRAIGTLRRDEDERACVSEALAVVRAALGREPGREAGREDTVEDRGADSMHPAGLRELSSPALGDTRVVEGRLDPRRMPHLDDHRVGGARVVAGAELALLSLAAAERGAQQVAGPWTIEGLTIPTALLIGEDEQPSVQVLTRPCEGGLELELVARAAHSWTTHLRGRLRAGASLPEPIAEPGDDRRAIAIEPLYRDLAERGLDYGPAFRVVTSLERDEQGLVAELTPDASLTPWAQAVVSLDAALHALLSLDASGRAFVPVSIERLAVLDRLDRTTRVIGRIEQRIGQGDNEVIEASARLLDREGRIVGAIDRLRLAALTGLRVELPELIRTQWEPVELAGGGLGRRYLLVGGGELGSQLAARLRAAGETVAEADSGPLHADALAQVDALIWLRGLALDREPGRGDAEGPTGAAVVDPLLDACAELLTLVRTLASCERGCPQLYLMSVGLVDAGPTTSCSQAAVDALASTLAYELPRLGCTRIDVPSRTLEPALLERLIEGLRAATIERRLALRERGWLAARLRCASVSTGEGLVVSGTQLITGGLGGLGLALARWLAERGAERLVLLGRSGTLDASAAEAIARIEQLGVKVMVRACDVADHEALAAVFAELGESPAGVFHLAGVLDDGLLVEQTRERFAKVMAGKVAGAWNLHRLCVGLPVRHFVLFSSITATIGSPGQGNYAAANGFLDALAERRRGLGLPVVALGFGPFAELGMVASAAQELGDRGLPPLRPDRGLLLLERVLADPELVRVGVAKLELSRWLAAYPALADSPTFASLGRAHGRSVVAAHERTPSLAEQLEGAPPARRARLLIERVRAEAARALRVDVERLRPHTDLSTVGLDSLTGLELRNRLETATGLELPASFVWAHPRLDALAEQLDARLRPSLEPEAAPQPEADELSALSEAELLRVLSAELES